MNDPNDPCVRAPDYSDHVGNGFSILMDGFGTIICVGMIVCCVLFGWPLYLLSKLATRRP